MTSGIAKPTPKKGPLMKKSGMYTITLYNNDIVVRLDRDLIDDAALKRFLDYLELESIRKRSKLTEKQAARLAEEVDRAAWESSKPQFMEESG
jgi:hypothetical protein